MSKNSSQINENTIKLLQSAKKVVVKIGSSLLVHGDNVNIAKRFMLKTRRIKSVSVSKIKKYANFIHVLKKQNKEVILVSSGAMASAWREKAFSDVIDSNVLINDNQLPNSETIVLRQVMSSVGQINLMQTYQKAFYRKKITIAQILLSKTSLQVGSSYVNAQNTIHRLLELNILPIINENDPLATDELKVGDNDLLGALVCELWNADLYIILSDVEGLYENYKTKNQTLIPHVSTISKNIVQKTQAKPFSGKSTFGTGGMYTKIKAAEFNMKNSIPTFITSGKVAHLYRSIFHHGHGTLFNKTNR